MAIAPAAAFGYLAMAGALGDAIHEAVIFTLQRYSAIGSVPYGAFASLANVGIVVFIPVTLLLSAITMRSELWATPHARVSFVLAIVALISAYPRPDAPHLTYALPLATPMCALGLAALLNKIKGSGYSIPVRAALVGVCIWLIGLSVASRIIACRCPGTKL